jgi:hypothetical protein
MIKRLAVMAAVSAVLLSTPGKAAIFKFEATDSQSQEFAGLTAQLTIFGPVSYSAHFDSICCGPPQESIAGDLNNLGAFEFTGGGGGSIQGFIESVNGLRYDVSVNLTVDSTGLFGAITLSGFQDFLELGANGTDGGGSVASDFGFAGCISQCFFDGTWTRLDPDPAQVAEAPFTLALPLLALALARACARREPVIRTRERLTAPSKIGREPDAAE